MPFGMGFGELVLILVIVVVLFGATKLPNLGDGLGNALRISQERDVQRRRRLSPAHHQQWTPSEWALVVAAVVLTAVLLGNAVMATAPRR